MVPNPGPGPAASTYTVAAKSGVAQSDTHVRIQTKTIVGVRSDVWLLGKCSPFIECPFG